MSASSIGNCHSLIARATSFRGPARTSKALDETMHRLDCPPRLPAFGRVVVVRRIAFHVKGNLVSKRNNGVRGPEPEAGRVVDQPTQPVDVVRSAVVGQLLVESLGLRVELLVDTTVSGPGGHAGCGDCRGREQEGVPGRISHAGIVASGAAMAQEHRALNARSVSSVDAAPTPENTTLCRADIP